LYSATVFIISKRKELSVKYKKLLKALNHEVYVISNLAEAFREIPNKEPELIIISDTIGEELSDFCEKIRVLTFNFRPIIIALSKSSEEEDRTKVLNAGADDFLSEPISSLEFQARINAHLRRYIENSLNPVTFFVQKNFTLKYLNRIIDAKKDCAVILLDILGLNLYREIYSELAYEKVLQTVASIVNSTLNSEDFVGHHFGSELVMVTTIEKAQKVAQFLVFAFENVVERFYSKNDFENKFIIFSGDEKIENKIPLMKLGVAVIQNENGRYKDYKDVMNSLYMILKMCKKSEKSSCYFDRLQLQGQGQEKNKKILITESDEALSYLLQTNCNLNGFDAYVVEKGDDILSVYNSLKPSVVIVDYGREDTKEGISICEKIKLINKNTKIIFSSSLHAKKEILSAGADLYLPKPYEINALIKWIQKFLDE